MVRDANIFPNMPIYLPHLAFIYVEGTCRNQFYLTFDGLIFLTIDANNVYIQYLKVRPQIYLRLACISGFLKICRN